MVLKICMQIECSQNNFCQLFCIDTQAIFWALLMSKCTCVCSTGSQSHMFSLLDMVPPGVLCCLLKTHVNLFKFCLTGFLDKEQVLFFCLFCFLPSPFLKWIDILQWTTGMFWNTHFFLAEKFKNLSAPAAVEKIIHYFYINDSVEISQQRHSLKLD